MSPVLVITAGARGQVTDGGMWAWKPAYHTASTMFSSGPMSQIDDPSLPHRTTVAALAVAWNGSTETLRQEVRDAHALAREDTIPRLVRAIGVGRARRLPLTSSVTTCVNISRRRRFLRYFYD